MRLIELEPSFIGSGGEGVSDSNGNPVPERKGIGLICNCPCGCDQQLFVAFANPLDGGAPTDLARPAWQRTGETFETLTLTPSILRRKWKHADGSEHGCGWHGFITNGEIKTC